MMGYDASMNATNDIGEVRYDYDRQTWVRWDGEVWRVEMCGHLDRKPTCYACEHAGEAITTGLEKIR